MTPATRTHRPTAPNRSGLLDREQVRLADRLAARRRQVEAANAKRRAIRTSAARDVAMFEHAGLVQRVRVELRGEACESCSRLTRRAFSFSQAQDVLPNRECTNPRGWCDGAWAAERRLHLRIEGSADPLERAAHHPLVGEVEHRHAQVARDA